MAAIECTERESLVIDGDLVLTVVQAGEDGVELQLKSLSDQKVVLDVPRQQDFAPALLAHRPAHARS